LIFLKKIPLLIFPKPFYASVLFRRLTKKERKMESKAGDYPLGLGNKPTARDIDDLATQVRALSRGSCLEQEIHDLCDCLLSYGGSQGKVSMPTGFDQSAIAPTIDNVHRVLETLHKMLQSIEPCDSSDQLVAAGAALKVLKDGIMTKTSADDARAMTELGDDVNDALNSLDGFVAECNNRSTPKPASGCSPISKYLQSAVWPKVWLATLAAGGFFVKNYYAAALDPAWSSMAIAITGSDTPQAQDYCADGTTLAAVAAVYGVTKGLYHGVRWFCCASSKPSNHQDGLRQPGSGGGNTDSLLEGGGRLS
jgi:hypothetical protein